MVAYIKREAVEEWAKHMGQIRCKKKQTQIPNKTLSCSLKLGINFFIPILDLSWVNVIGVRDFVKMWAICSEDGTKSNLRSPAVIFSLKMWQSISMCLVRSWKIGFEAICMVDWLSQKSVVSSMYGMPKSFRRKVSHCNSHVVIASVLYSASYELLDIVCCFFYFHEIRDSPKKIEKLVTDFLVFGQVAQLESLYPWSCMEMLWLKKMPEHGFPLRYLKMRNSACWWALVGEERNSLRLLTLKTISGLVFVR